MKKFEIPTRPTGPRKTCSVNENFFNEPSHNMYYILGYTFADGNLYDPYGTSNNKVKSVRYTSIDYQLIKDVVDAMQSTYKISYRESKDCYYTNILSDKLFDQLISFGLSINKTEKGYDYPDIPTKYNPSFIRGFFDGDGSVGETTQNRWFVNFRGCEVFLRDLKLVLLENSVDFKLYTVNLNLCSGSKKMIERFKNFIYSTPGIRLERKYNKFNELFGDTHSN